jgi:hypothetical protein
MAFSTLVVRHVAACTGTEPETDLKRGKARLISACDLDEGVKLAKLA